LGKGGIDITPSEERPAPSPPPHLKSDTEATGSPESLTKATTKHGEQPPATPSTKLLPRETGQDIGMGSPVPLSSEAVDVIRRLRNMKVVTSPHHRYFLSHDCRMKMKTGVVGVMSFSVQRVLLLHTVWKSSRRRRQTRGEEVATQISWTKR
jgi:hypothetical protein